MLLLPFLPALFVLVGGAVLWVLILVRPSRLEALGLASQGEPPQRDARVAALVVLSYLPLREVVAAIAGVGRGASPVEVMQAIVVANLLVVALFAAGLLAVRARRRNVCHLCDSPGPETICPVCGATRSLDPAPRSQAEAFGLKWQLSSLKVGVAGLFLAYPLVILAMLLSAPLRSADKIHPFLKTLLENRTDEIVFWVFTSAAFAAPLAEELVFRVGLQGWLRNRCRPAFAVGVTAVLFSAIHGWPDMIGILPLAIVLGVVYERTNDYLAVVVTHALFNALMTWNTYSIDPEQFRKALEELEKANAAAQEAAALLVF